MAGRVILTDEWAYDRRAAVLHDRQRRRRGRRLERGGRGGRQAVEAPAREQGVAAAGADLSDLSAANHRGA